MSTAEWARVMTMQTEDDEIPFKAPLRTAVTVLYILIYL